MSFSHMYHKKFISNSVISFLTINRLFLEFDREQCHSTKGHQRRRKEKLPAMSSLITQSKALLSKKRKARYLEFSNDPVTGRRNCKGTYSPSRRRKRCATATATNQNANLDAGEIGTLTEIL